MKIRKLNESRQLKEGIEVETIVDYITDHYKFETVDDKYSCIDSIKDSFKDEKTISKEELEQFIDAHNGKDRGLEESLSKLKDMKVWTRKITKAMYDLVQSGALGENIRSTYTDIEIRKVSNEDMIVGIFRLKGARALDVISQCEEIPEVKQLLDSCPYDVYITDNEHVLYGTTLGLDTVKVYVSDKDNQSSTELEESATHCVYFTQDGIDQIEFEGSEDECYNYISSIESEQDDEFGDGALERFIKRLDESMKDYRFEVSCNNGPTKVVKLIWDEKDVEGAKEMAKKYYAQEHTTYADDRHNKWIIEESLNDKKYELEESKISGVEPNFHFQGKLSHTFTKDEKWEVDFDEKGNILARTRHGKPSYFKGHINDKTSDFPSTDEDNIILAAREQHRLKFGNNELIEALSPIEGDRVQMDFYAKDNNGATGTCTGRIGELCFIEWDDGTKSKEIKGYLKVIERPNMNEESCSEDSTPLYIADTVELEEEQLDNDTAWRERKKQIDVKKVDTLVYDILEKADTQINTGMKLDISKHHYKSNFLRYDIYAGYIYGHLTAEEQDNIINDEILPKFKVVKEECQKNGWKAYYVDGHERQYFQIRIPYSSLAQMNLLEASYGGAYDIADDQIFTREDIDALAEEVLAHINETYDYQFDISAAYIDGNELEVGVENDELGEYMTTLKIDMRKVKEPWHLKRVYAFEVASDLINQISRSLNGLGESLTESNTEGAKPIETGAALGMATVLSDLIKDEYEAIDGYNTAIATAKAEGFGDMIKVLTDIQAEENIHIGQLQELMKMVDPNASKIEDGTVEAEEILSNPSVNEDDDFNFESIDESFDVFEDDIADEDVDVAIKAVEEAMKEPNKEEFDLTNASFDLDDDDETIVESTEPWEDIYNSFKDIEFQLNGDGEAITATIDRIYNDNKGNPDFEKAYKKWAANE